MARRIPVYRCPCGAVFDYHPTHHPTVTIGEVWKHYSLYHGKLERETAPGCPTCGVPRMLRVGTMLD